MKSIRDELKALGFRQDVIDGVRDSYGRPIADDASTGQSGASGAVLVIPGNPFKIVVPGTAIGKPRMTQRDKWQKRPAVVRYRDWCDRIRAAVGDSLPSVDRIVSLNWVAYFEPAASWSKKRRVAAIGTQHRQKPDRDNIDKAVLDCLFEYDEGIADGWVRKRWDWKARIEIEIFTDEAGA